MIQVEKLEDTYDNLLRVVHREVVRLKSNENLEGNDIRLLPELEKMLRNAMGYYSLKPIKNEMTGKSTEDLLELLD
jgi:hypothetical protein